jgi:hypothetical protein
MLLLSMKTRIQWVRALWGLLRLSYVHRSLRPDPITWSNLFVDPWYSRHEKALAKQA